MPTSQEKQVSKLTAKQCAALLASILKAVQQGNAHGSSSDIANQVEEELKDVGLDCSPQDDEPEEDADDRDQDHLFQLPDPVTRQPFKMNITLTLVECQKYLKISKTSERLAVANILSDLNLTKQTAQDLLAEMIRVEDFLK